MADSLAPPSEPVGRFPRFMSPRPQTLVLKEKMMSLLGGSFVIKTIEGQPILRAKGHLLSWSGRKEHATFYAEHPTTAENIFWLKGKISWGKSKSTGSFVSANGRQEDVAMDGDFFDSFADITHAKTGQHLAHINRDFVHAHQLVGCLSTYHVTVAPNVDVAIMAAMTICLDERRNENSL